MDVVISNIFELRKIAEEVFGEHGFIEKLERRGYYKSRIASVVDTEWEATSNELIAYHWTVDPTPIIEKFYFPPTWANKESWKNIFNSEYPDCAEEALDIAVWTARTPSKIVLEDDYGVRTIKAIDTDAVSNAKKTIFVKKQEVKSKNKKRSNDLPTLFGEIK
jgi:hypothetical protein